MIPGTLETRRRSQRSWASGGRSGGIACERHEVRSEGRAESRSKIRAPWGRSWAELGMSQRHFIGTTLALCRARRILHFYCIATALLLHWYCIGAIAGTAQIPYWYFAGGLLVLRLYCTGIVGVPHRHCAGTRRYSTTTAVHLQYQDPSNSDPGVPPRGAEFRTTRTLRRSGPTPRPTSSRPA